MDKEQFLETLAKNKSKLNWVLSEGALIRVLDNTDHECTANSCSGGELCPLTGIAFLLTGNRFAINNYLEAASEIGLDEDTACYIVDQADTHSRHLDGEELELRASLLKACGLEEVEEEE